VLNPIRASGFQSLGRPCEITLRLGHPDIERCLWMLNAQSRTKKALRE